MVSIIDMFLDLIEMIIILSVILQRVVNSSGDAMKRSQSISASSDTLEYAMKFLSLYGYLPKSDMTSVNLRSEDQLRYAIAKMQKFANLVPNGVLDNTTIAMMKRKRCGVPDLFHYSMHERVKRYALQGSKWQKTDLTWSVKHWSRDIDSRYVLNELKKAFKVWSDVSKLTFIETRRADADIVISFLSGWHGDEYPFDGRGSILAHAFFPGTGIGGDIHFDADEQWSRTKHNRVTDDNEDEDEWQGVSLFAVAAHEFGHSLGLSHSSVAGSLMFPYYQNIKEDFKLPYDDTVGIQQLYGSKTPNKWAPMPPLPTKTPFRTSDTTVYPSSTSIVPVKGRTTLRPTIPKISSKFPNVCNISFDAIASIRKDIFFFKDKFFWWLLENKTFARLEPNLIYRYWTGLPDNTDRIDAIYERSKDKKIVFFIGKKYWVFNNNQAEDGYPRPLTNLGLPHYIDKIDAAMIWGHNGKTYLFSGKYYWRFEEEENAVELDYPRDISVWNRIPYNIDAAFQWSLDGQTYFFKGLEFWKFDNRKMTVTDGFPLHISQFWFESLCATTRVNPKLIPNTPSIDTTSIINKSADIKMNFKLYLIFANALLFYNYFIHIILYIYTIKLTIFK